MGERAFRWSLLLMAGGVLLSGTTFPGLLIGLFCAFSIAFFLAPLGFLIKALLHGAGIDLSLQVILLSLALLYVLGTLLVAVRAWRFWRWAKPDHARLAAAQVCLLAVLPLIAYLSSQALMRAWH